MTSFFGSLFVLAIVVFVIKYRDQIEARIAANIVQIIRTVGIIAILFGTLDLAGTLAGRAYRAVVPLTSGMQDSSGRDFGGHSTFETKQSEYMYEFANVVEEFSQAQSRQRLQLNVIIICFGTFLVAYGLRQSNQSGNLVP